MLVLYTRAFGKVFVPLCELMNQSMVVHLDLWQAIKWETPDPIQTQGCACVDQLGSRYHKESLSKAHALELVSEDESMKGWMTWMRQQKSGDKKNKLQVK